MHPAWASMTGITTRPVSAEGINQADPREKQDRLALFPFCPFLLACGENYLQFSVIPPQQCVHVCVCVCVCWGGGWPTQREVKETVKNEGLYQVAGFLLLWRALDSLTHSSIHPSIDSFSSFTYSFTHALPGTVLTIQFRKQHTPALLEPVICKENQK